jgi:hypothetical protein
MEPCTWCSPSVTPSATQPPGMTQIASTSPMSSSVQCRPYGVTAPHWPRSAAAAQQRLAGHAVQSSPRTEARAHGTAAPTTGKLQREPRRARLLSRRRHDQRRVHALGRPRASAPGRGRARHTEVRPALHRHPQRRRPRPRRRRRAVIRGRRSLRNTRGCAHQSPERRRWTQPPARPTPERAMPSRPALVNLRTRQTSPGAGGDRAARRCPTVLLGLLTRRQKSTKFWDSQETGPKAGQRMEIPLSSARKRHVGMPRNWVAS